MMLDINTFGQIIDSTALISIDFIVKNEDNKILLGKRVNKPAKGFFFTIGGRIYKNEKIYDTKKRILNDELNLDITNLDLKFIGVFEHFYTDSFLSDKISTHYVNFAYEIKVSYIQDLPKEQHSNYVWLSLEELLKSKEVHNYVKDYFINSNCNI